MQQVSEQYKAEMRRDFRHETLAQIKFGLVSVDAVDNITHIEKPHEAAISRLESALVGEPKAYTYASFEDGRFVLNSNALCVPEHSDEVLSLGYVSEVCSNAQGIFVQQPALRFTFAKQLSVAGLSFVFDLCFGEYPSVLQIQAFRNGVKIASDTVRPTAANYVYDKPLNAFDALQIIWVQSNRPQHRARLQQLLFGIELAFHSCDITELAQISEVDPLSRRLPQHTLTFTTINANEQYSPDSSNGYWDYMELHSPITLRYGQTLEDGSIEWLQGGKYCLTSRPCANESTVTFEGQSLLEGMTQPFLYGKVQAATLYDLAQEVLLCANLPLTDTASHPWQLWKGLHQITTTSPLPKQSMAECLQLIAHAAQCSLSVNRNGEICILPLDETHTGSCLDFDVQIGAQTVEKTSALYAVACKFYSHAPEPAAKELAKTSVFVNENLDLFLEFNGPAIDITIEAVGATVAYESFAHGVQLHLVGNGNAEIVVHGKLLAPASATTLALVANGDANGSTLLVENPLIGNATQAQSVAAWMAKHLANRTAYSFSTRGTPEVDALDIITAENRHGVLFPATVLRSETIYNGTLQGSVTAKQRSV